MVDTSADPFQPWPDGLLWRPVSPKLIAVKLIELWATVLGLTVIGIGALWFFPDLRASWPALLAVTLLGLLRTFAIVRGIHAWGYAERDDDLLVRHGLLRRRLSIVPYARMQFVDVSAGPLERAFGLANVQLHTASASSDAVVPGLAGAEARRLRDRLAELGNDRTAGL